MPGRGMSNRSVHALPTSPIPRHELRDGGCVRRTVKVLWGKIQPMKARLPQPVHESYRRHRRELAWQIILPIALTALLFIVLIVLINIATFNQGGDVGRWAAVSTIWIIVPVMLAGLILLALLVALVYLMKQVLGITPRYTGLAQDYVNKASGYVKRATEMAVKPVLFLDGIGASIKAFFGRK